MYLVSQHSDPYLLPALMSQHDFVFESCVTSQQADVVIIT